MIRIGNRLVTLGLAILVTPIFAVAPTFVNPTTATAETAAPASKLSAAQLKKLIGYAATNGKVVTVDKHVTDTLGLTTDKEEVYSPALTVKERTGEILHQMQPLPGDKGYLFGNIGPTTVQVYWADKSLVLIAAMTSVSGGPTAGMTGGKINYPTPIKDAEPAFRQELAYWAMVADSL